ncbi:TerC family protein [Noviherbaspirillum autotrophicum]|uniref:Membrane protein n=1 Tax=Noviherbaspirillum autotrophicum TaxID=709839 RepID=A0A0C1Y3P7_9BURK|nr:TerC family protein [Noviherbaspirillum autotrophicum]KIF81728.1 membrane protein [Noviherbaspirillum autotrophicum]
MDFLLNLNWLAVGQIILIDILLGGDNAIVIAMACRNLPRRHRIRGILWGTFGAIGIRIILIAFAVTMLQVPYLKIVGGILLFWIGIKLLAEGDDGHDDVHASERLLTAIKTIIMADLVMSIDNVIAVASAAEQTGGDNQLVLVTFGILVSIPIIIWGSTVILKLMEHFPWIVTFGAGLLGYLAGGMVVTDVGVAPWVDAHLPLLDIDVPVLDVHMSIPGLLTAAVVIIVGNWMAKREEARHEKS